MTVSLEIKNPQIRRLAKVMLLAMPLTLVFKESLGLLGVHKSLHFLYSTVLAGVTSPLLVDCLFSPKKVREERKMAYTAWVKGHWALLLKGALYALVLLFCLHTRKTPAEPFVQQCMKMVKPLSIISILLYPGFVFAFARKMPNDGMGLLQYLIKAFMAYNVVLWSIGDMGDSIYRWSASNPDASMAFLVAFLASYAVLLYSARDLRSAVLIQPKVEFAAATSLPSRKATVKDGRYASTHEAAHIMLYAALDCLPDDLQATIKKHLDDSGSLGFVSGHDYPNRLTETSYAQWLMLLLLAGKVGEECLLGATVLGSGSDLQKWQTVAKGYLANHDRGIFYTVPQTPLEQKANEEKLLLLQAEQKMLLRSFYDKNRQILKELAHALQQQTTMEKQELMPFLNRTELPDGFPRASLNTD